MFYFLLLIVVFILGLFVYICFVLFDVVKWYVVEVIYVDVGDYLVMGGFMVVWLVIMGDLVWLIGFIENIDWIIVLVGLVGEGMIMFVI